MILGKLSIFIKSPDFNEIKEITDFSQFSKESLLPFGVLALENCLFYKDEQISVIPMDF